MYIYVDFGDPIGNYCEATSFSFSTLVQRVSGGPPYISQRFDVHFTKETDSLTRDIWLSICNGTTIPSVTAEFWKTEKACTLMATMTNVVITSFSSSGGQYSQESIAMDAESIKFRSFT